MALTAELRNILSRFICSWIEGRKDVPLELDDAVDDLLSGLRGRSTYELLKLLMESQGDSGFQQRHRVIAEHHGAGPVYDLPHALSQINGQQLTLLGRGVRRGNGCLARQPAEPQRTGLRCGRLQANGSLPGVTTTTPRGSCSSS